MNEIGLPMKPPFEHFPSMKFNYAKTLAKVQTAGLLKQFFIFETSTTLTTQIGETLPVIKTHPLRFKLPNYETMVAIIRVVNELIHVQLSANDQLLQFERVHAVEKFFNLMEDVIRFSEN